MNVMSIWSQSRSSECKLPVVRTGRRPVAEQRAQRTVCSVLALVSTLALGLGSPCLASSQQISGTITDALGRPLAQVSLQLRDRNGQIIAHAATDEGGRFKIAPPKPGVYSLVAAKSGFKSASKIVVFPRNAGETISIALGAEKRADAPRPGQPDSRSKWRLCYRRQ